MYILLKLQLAMWIQKLVSLDNRAIVLCLGINLVVRFVLIKYNFIGTVEYQK
jgi:hypothetical protein